MRHLHKAEYDENYVQIPKFAIMQPQHVSVAAHTGNAPPQTTQLPYMRLLISTALTDTHRALQKQCLNCERIRRINSKEMVTDEAS